MQPQAVRQARMGSPGGPGGALHAARVLLASASWGLLALGVAAKALCVPPRANWLCTTATSCASGCVHFAKSS
jgi:hypothetical protein